MSAKPARVRALEKALEEERARQDKKKPRGRPPKEPGRTETERKYISVYSKQKKDETGNGIVTLSFYLNDPDLKKKIADARAEQRAENDRYTQARLDGEDIPRKFTSPTQRLKKAEARIAELEAQLAIPNNEGAKDEKEKPKATRPRKIVNDEISEEDNVQDLIKSQKKQAGPKRLKFKESEREPLKLQLDKGTGNTIFVLGSSKMGKSTALMKIYDKYYADSRTVSILWTCNPQIKLYKRHKHLLIAGVDGCGGLDSDAQNLIKSQKKIQTGTKNKYQFLNIFDDVIAVRNNALLDNLILTYRNSKMSSIISLQYSNLMSKCGRANCNNILAFGFNTDEAIEVVIKTFLISYLTKKNKDAGNKTAPSMPEMIQWYKEATSNHGFIYIKPADGHVSFHRFEL